MVSVIIPCYNSEKYINDTLDSIKNQSYQNWECIIVDDGSTDNSTAIIKNICDADARFKLINSQNNGVSAARNLGLSYCKGKYVQFLDSDDLLANDKISVCVDFLEKNNNIDVVYTGARYFYSSYPNNFKLFGRNYLTPVIELTQYDNDILDAFFLRNPFVTSAPLYRYNIFNEVGNYDESFNFLEDWDFQIRCALQNLKFHYLGFMPNIATYIRLHDNSLMTNRKKVVEAKIKLRDKYKSFDKNNILLGRVSTQNSLVKIFNKIFNFLKFE